jgi:hypothetical protein
MSDERGCPTSTITVTSAVPYQDNFLLVADSNPPSIRQLSLLSNTYVQLLQYRLAGTPIAVAFDSALHEIYWTDVYYNAVYKYSLSTRNVTRVLYDVTQQAVYDGLTLDSAQKKLYYTDAGYGRVGEFSYGGVYSHRFITWENDTKPRGVVLDSNNRILYWTDWQDSFPGIYRSHVANFNNKTAIVTGGLVWPNALAIDFSVSLMYWGDAYLDKIERSNLDGTERTTLLVEASAHYYAFALDPTFIYFTDWNFNYIRKMNRVTLETSFDSRVLFGRANGITVSISQGPTSSSSTTMVSTPPPPSTPTTTTTTTTTTSTRPPTTTTTTTTTTTSTTPPTTTTSPYPGSRSTATAAELMSTSSPAMAYSLFTTATTTTTTTTSTNSGNRSAITSADTGIQTVTIIIAVVVVVGVIITVAVITIGVVCCVRRARIRNQPTSAAQGTVHKNSASYIYGDTSGNGQDNEGYDRIGNVRSEPVPHTYQGLQSVLTNTGSDNRYVGYGDGIPSQAAQDSDGVYLTFDAEVQAIYHVIDTTYSTTVTQ